MTAKAMRCFAARMGRSAHHITMDLAAAGGHRLAAADGHRLCDRLAARLRRASQRHKHHIVHFALYFRPFAGAFAAAARAVAGAVVLRLRACADLPIFFPGRNAQRLSQGKVL